jgi:hypothetical protein
VGNGSFWSAYAQEVKAAIILVERKLSKRGCPRYLLSRAYKALIFGLDNRQIEMFSNVGTTSLFLHMCDAIEGAVDGVPGSTIPEEGIGLEKALPNFASWFKTYFIANRE